jgi:hypothetical protein
MKSLQTHPYAPPKRGFSAMWNLKHDDKFLDKVYELNKLFSITFLMF